MATLSAYEQERLDRIRQNNLKLLSLEIPTLARAINRRDAPAKRKSEQVQTEEIDGQPLPRRSTRARPDLAASEISTTDLPRIMNERERRHRIPGPRITSDVVEEHDQHNEHRILTMSDKALYTRIHKITNLGKLRSFVQALVEYDKATLAAAAAEVLSQREVGNWDFKSQLVCY